jgi:formate dehydrogenase major subunit
MFLTETAKLATVVLPAASFAEKEGTFTNFEGRVQRVRKAIEPLDDSLPDLKIILQLAERMGHPMPYSSPQQVMDEIEELVPLYQRLAYSDFEREDLDWADVESGRLGARRLYKGPFPSGFGRFSPIGYAPPINVSGDEYPLILISGSILHHFGSGTRSLRASRLKRYSPDSWVEISEADAERLGFSDGEAVKVVSSLGEVTTTFKVTDTLPSGMVFMPMSFPESPVNDLFGIALDPRAKTPSLKGCSVRLDRISADD